LREHGVTLHANAAGICITPEAVTFSDREGIPRSVPADHVIVAKGALGDTVLAEQIRAAGFSVRVIGDAVGVGYVEGAMRAAAQAAAEINGSV
jgi:hypothetical protein